MPIESSLAKSNSSSALRNQQSIYASQPSLIGAHDLCGNSGNSPSAYSAFLLNSGNNSNDSCDKNNSNGKFLGFKERRRSSALKISIGDYLNLANEPHINKIMSKNTDNQILFSDVVVKVNRRNKMQERILLLTENSVYNIDPTNYKVKRKIPLDSIGEIKMSKLPDNFFCICVPEEYDYLMQSSKKIEFVTKLSESYEKKLRRPLIITFSNCFTYHLNKDMYREIQFSLVEGGISTQIFEKKKSK